MLKIIDNKRIDLTEDEYKIYQSICGSYPGGKEMFQNLFETDDNGIILFLIPPKQYCAMEVVIFLQNIMIHQHLRLLYNEYNEALNFMKNKISEMESRLNVKNNS
jgi:hypothetical protein